VSRHRRPAAPWHRRESCRTRRVDVVNLVPGLAAVGGLEQTAFFVRTIQSSERADINDIGVFGMDDDSANLKGLVKAFVLPVFAAVGREVDAIAIGDGVARVGLAGADPDDVAIGGCYGDRADGYGFFLIELMFKRGAIVDRFEQTAGGRRRVIRGRIGLVDRQGGDAAAHVGGADRTPG